MTRLRFNSLKNVRFSDYTLTNVHYLCRSIKDLKKQKKGGFRAGSDRKSKYENIETCVMRVPKFLRGEIEMFIEEKMIQYGKPKHQTSYDLTSEHNREEKN